MIRTPAHKVTPVIAHTLMKQAFGPNPTQLQRRALQRHALGVFQKKARLPAYALTIDYFGSDS